MVFVWLEVLVEKMVGGDSFHCLNGTPVVPPSLVGILNAGDFVTRPNSFGAAD